MRLIVLAAALFALTACVARPPPKPVSRFTKPGATQQQYMADRYACYQESAQNASGAYVNQYAGAAQSGVVHSHNAWLACMGGRGYVLDPNGDLAPPPGMEISFQRP
jgi:hypothetical protein